MSNGTRSQDLQRLQNLWIIRKTSILGLNSKLFIGLLSILLHLSAQSQDYQEEVHLSLNTTNILVGEPLHFSAFVYSNKTKHLSTLSSVLYVELVDESGIAVHQTKIGLRNGRGSGSFAINPDWLSSTYRIIAYTKWMRNYSSYFEQKLLVLNPYASLSYDQEVRGNPLSATFNTSDETVFGLAEVVSLNFGSIEPASLSVTIHETPDLRYSNAIEVENPQVNLSTYDILPEHKYALVQGRVESSAENSGKRINLTIKGESFQTATTTTDEFGRFWISYNPDIAANDAVVQLQTEDSEVKVSEVFSEFYDEYSALDSSVVILDSVAIANLVSRSVNSQIQFAYQEQQKLDTEQRQVYTREEALVYYLKDYKRFSSVRDLFIELTIYVGVSKLEESDKMFVRVEELAEVTEANLPPLILLDGLRTDSRTILNQSPNDIQKIEVIPSHYFVNDMVYKGVISVHTFGRAKSPPPPPGFTYSLATHQPYTDLGHEVILAKHLPLYESDLLWDPIYAHQGGELVLEFATSRLEGKYQAIITGITKSGQPVNITRYFQIKAANQ